MISKSQNSPILLVLAAGLGSRYGGLKQLEKIGPHGETLMDYSIYDAHKAGFRKIVFLIRKEMHEQFQSQVGEKYTGIVEVDYAFQDKHDLPAGYTCPIERERPWGTGHAVWAARKSLENNPFAVINADDYYGYETFQTLYNSITQTEDVEVVEELFSMVGFLLSETLSDHGLVSRGICRATEGYLESVEEWTKIGGSPVSGFDSNGGEGLLNGSEIVSMNVWGFPSSVLKMLENEFVKFLSSIDAGDLNSEFYLPSAVDASIRSGFAKVKVNMSPCSWIGVTYKEDKPLVMSSISNMVQKGTYSSPLWSD